MEGDDERTADNLVALRKESVDRNQLSVPAIILLPPSLSARRAWIEIVQCLCRCRCCIVALRKESVDRNVKLCAQHVLQIVVALRKESVDRNFLRAVLSVSLAASLSARRAWIEISRAANFQHRSHVALRKESVDRNFFARVGIRDPNCRSPQGERG